MLIRRKQRQKPENIIEQVQPEIAEQNIYDNQYLSENTEQGIMETHNEENQIPLQNFEQQNLMQQQMEQMEQEQIHAEILAQLQREEAQNAALENIQEPIPQQSQVISSEIQKQFQEELQEKTQTQQIIEPPPAISLTPEMELAKKLEEIEKIDVTSLEFKERFERRRGERRRGYRRIDERTLVSRAQEEAQSIRELAAKEGYKNGIEEATGELENLKNSLAEFLGAKKEAYNVLSEEMLELSLEIAKKIIKKEVELSGDVLKSVLSEVFDEISSNEEKITIKVALDEVEFARVSIPEIMQNSAIDAKIIVVPDAAVEKGSCVVMASNGVIDANFSTQLQIIQNAFGIYKGGA